MFDLFFCMFKEEWRMHSTMLGNLNFALFPFLIFAIAFMGSFLLPLTSRIMDLSVMALLIHGLFALMGVMVGSFGISGNAMMNERFGQGSLLMYSARTLPLSDRKIFLNFIIKDIVYYFVLWIIPFCMGFLLASPFTGVEIYYPALLFLTVTLSFLFGMCAVFFLSTVYTRSKYALLLIVIGILIAGCASVLKTGNSILTILSLFFLPVSLFITFSYEILLIAILFIAVLFSVSVFLFSVKEMRSVETHYKSRILSFTKMLSFLPNNVIVAKELIDFYRSGMGIGQTLFSLVMPVCLIWMLLSVLEGVLSHEKVFFVLALMVGLISSTMYTWITAFDNVSIYLSLPIKVSSIITAKTEFFIMLQIIPFILLVMVAWLSNVISFLLYGIIITFSISFFGLSIIIRLCGLYPNVLIYNVKVFGLYVCSLIPAILILLYLSFTNEIYSLVALLLLIPTYFLMKSGLKKWDREDNLS